MELREMLTSYRLPGRRDADRARQCAGGVGEQIDRPECAGYKCIRDLLDVVDNYIPPGEGAGQAVHDADRGCVLDQRAAGQWSTGRCGSWAGQGRRTGGRSWDWREKSMNSVVTGVEMFHKMLDEGQAGDNLGLLLRGIERTDVERGR